MIKSFLKNIKGDKAIWGVVVLLCALSILAIYSSSASLTFGKGYFTTYLIRQVGFVLLGFAAIYLTHRIPIGWYRKLALPLLIISAILLVLALVLGAESHGAKRTFLGFQPADLARIGMVLYLAKTIEKEALSTFKDIVKKIVLPVILVFVLIALGSTSAALLLLITVALILIVAEIPMKYLIKIGAIVVLVLGLYVADGYTTKVLPRSVTAVHRMEDFFKNDEANKEDNTQAAYSKMAVASGGVIGKGPGNSTQRYILSQAYSDFIYAIIVEEYGLAGGITVLVLYLILLFRAIVIARSCTRVFPMLAVLGFVLAIICQALLNMGVAVGLVPVTGQPLPLVSLGGSSLLFTTISLGIVLSISRASEERDLPIKPSVENE